MKHRHTFHISLLLIGLFFCGLAAHAQSSQQLILDFKDDAGFNVDEVKNFLNETEQIKSVDLKTEGDICTVYCSFKEPITELNRSFWEGKNYSTSIVKYKKNLLKAIIPNSVTTIGDKAFYDCGSLTSVVIPNSVTTIGGNAFCGCHSLTNITIPNAVTTIGPYAFGECSSLSSVTLPSSVKTIWGNAFWACSGLKSISIPEGVTEIKESAFSECWSLLGFRGKYATPDGQFLIDSGKIIGVAFGAMGKAVSIPNSATEICEDSFRNCTSLTSVRIPNSVKTIGRSAFKGCSGLKTITIPEGVMKIDSEAFMECSGLTSVKIPNSVMEIGYQAFEDCDNLSSVNIPNPATSIDKYAFSSSTKVIQKAESKGGTIASTNQQPGKKDLEIPHFNSPESVLSYLARHSFKSEDGSIRLEVKRDGLYTNGKPLTGVEPQVIDFSSDEATLNAHSILLGVDYKLLLVRTDDGYLLKVISNTIENFYMDN